MTVAELIVKLSAVGGDEVKRKLNETEKDLKKTAKAAEETKKPFEDLEIAGINVSTAIKNAGKAFASITPEMAYLQHPTRCFLIAVRLVLSLKP